MCHPRFLQILDLSRDEPITEAALPASRFNQAASCTSDMHYHCLSPGQVASSLRVAPRRICDFIATFLNRFDSFVTRIDYTCHRCSFSYFRARLMVEPAEDFCAGK